MWKKKLIVNYSNDSARKGILKTIRDSYIPCMEGKYIHEITDTVHKFIIQKLLIDIREDLKNEIDLLAADNSQKTNEIYLTRYSPYDKVNYGTENFSFMFYPKFVCVPTRISIEKIARDKTKEREVIPEEFYKTTMKKFNYTCFNCGSKENLQVDHHIPKSKGGLDSLENFVLLCAKCNGLGGKGSKFPEEFYTNEQLEILKEVYNVF